MQGAGRGTAGRGSSPPRELGPLPLARHLATTHPPTHQPHCCSSTVSAQERQSIRASGSVRPTGGRRTHGPGSAAPVAGCTALAPVAAGAGGERRRQSWRTCPSRMQPQSHLRQILCNQVHILHIFASDGVRQRLQARQQRTARHGWAAHGAARHVAVNCWWMMMIGLTNCEFGSHLRTELCIAPACPLGAVESELRAAPEAVHHILLTLRSPGTRGSRSEPHTLLHSPVSALPADHGCLPPPDAAQP